MALFLAYTPATKSRLMQNGGHRAVQLFAAMAIATHAICLR